MLLGTRKCRDALDSTHDRGDNALDSCSHCEQRFALGDSYTIRRQLR